MTGLEPNAKPVRRLEWILLAAVLTAGLALRLGLWHTQPFVSIDGTAYIRLAWAIAGDGAYETSQPAGYPLLILLSKLLTPDWVLAARLVDLVSGLTVVWLTWLLGRSYIRNLWLRMSPALVVALLPLPVRYSLTTMSEGPYLVFLMGMFVLAARRRWLPAGILGGLAYLVRPEALTAVAALAVLSVRTPRRTVRILAGAALVVAPYVVIQGAITGTWTLTQKTGNIASAQWWENEPRVGEEPGSPAVGERLKEHGEASVSAYPARLGALAKQVVRHGGWVVPVVGVAGLVGPGLALLPALVQFFLTPAFALGPHARFVLPYLPFLWILAAMGIERIRAPALRIILGVLCLGGLATTVVRERPGYFLHEDGFFPELVEAGVWLRPFVGPESVVYGRKPYTAFYAGASYRSPPLGGYDETLDEIVGEGGDFLVVGQAVVDFFRPSLLPLCMDKPVAWLEPRLRPVYLNTQYQDRKTLVFRVVRPGGPEPLPVEENEKEFRSSLSALTHQPEHQFHGVLAMRGERWQTAAGEFAYAIEQDSTNTIALNNRAWCLLQAGLSLPTAEENARMAVGLRPENADYLDTLIEVLRAQGKHEEALRLAARLDSLQAAPPP